MPRIYLFVLNFVLQHLGGYAFQKINLLLPPSHSHVRPRYFGRYSSGDDCALGVQLYLSSRRSEDDLREEARRLSDQAQALRKQVEEYESSSLSSSSKKKKNAHNFVSATVAPSPWSLPPTFSAANKNEQEVEVNQENEKSGGVEYRLYVDIGREPGTWMDPRWGASGRRMEFTLDVRFLTASTDDKDDDVDVMVDPSYQQAMVQDNFAGTKSKVRKLQTAPFARLRSGFDRMKCEGGAYRIDSTGKGGDGTARIVLNVEGTNNNNDYGDISIPKGFLYFSLPAFNKNISLLSNKPGPVTVRQVGWNTGWRRQESRIVGVFRAVPLEAARRRDNY